MSFGYLVTIVFNLALFTNFRATNVVYVKPGQVDLLISEPHILLPVLFSKVTNQKEEAKFLLEAEGRKC